MPAIGALAGIDFVVIALIALILFVGLFPLYRPLIEGGLSAVPVVGGWLASNVDGLLFGAYLSAVNALSGQVQPLVDAIARFRWALVLLPTWTVNAIYAVWWATGRLYWFVIPDLEIRLSAQALKFTLAAEDYARFLAVNVWTAAQRIVAEANQYALTLTMAAESYALFEAVNVWAAAQRIVGEEAARALAAEAQLTAEAQLIGLQAERYAAQLAAQGIAYTQAAVLDAERFAERVGADAEGYARSLSDLVMGRVHTLAQDLTLADVAVAERVDAIERSPCQRYCDPLGVLGQFLQDLEGAGLLALLAALAASAVEDPRGTRDAVLELVQAPAQETAQVVASLAGVGR